MVLGGRKSPHLLFTGGYHIHDENIVEDVDNDISMMRILIRIFMMKIFLRIS